MHWLVCPNLISQQLELMLKIHSHLIIQIKHYLILIIKNQNYKKENIPLERPNIIEYINKDIKFLQNGSIMVARPHIDKTVLYK